MAIAHSEDASGQANSSDANEGQKLKLLCAFSDERWTNGRSVTDIDWSSKVSTATI